MKEQSTARRRARIHAGDAADLETYFAEHASAMGARSTLLGTIQTLQAGGPTSGGNGRNGTEAAMVARMGRVSSFHRPIERALRLLSPWHRSVLGLTYGVIPGAIPIQLRGELGIASAVALAMAELADLHAVARAASTNAPAEAGAWLLQLCAAHDEAALAGVAAVAERHLGEAHAAFREARQATRDTSAAHRQAASDRTAASRQRAADVRAAKRIERMRALFTPEGWKP